MVETLDVFVYLYKCSQVISILKFSEGAVLKLCAGAGAGVVAGFY